MGLGGALVEEVARHRPCGQAAEPLPVKTRAFRGRPIVRLARVGDERRVQVAGEVWVAWLCEPAWVNCSLNLVRWSTSISKAGNCTLGSRADVASASVSALAGSCSAGSGETISTPSSPRRASPSVPGSAKTASNSRLPRATHARAGHPGTGLSWPVPGRLLILELPWCLDLAGPWWHGLAASWQPPAVAAGFRGRLAPLGGCYLCGIGPAGTECGRHRRRRVGWSADGARCGGNGRGLAAVMIWLRGWCGRGPRRRGLKKILRKPCSTAPGCARM